VTHHQLCDDQFLNRSSVSTCSNQCSKF